MDVRSNRTGSTSLLDLDSHPWVGSFFVFRGVDVVHMPTRFRT